MSANVQTILIFILGISAALRDESFHLLDVPGEAPCPEAKRVTEPPFPTRFEIPSDRAKLLNFFDTWTLKESSSCAGNPVCEVAVAPRFNASEPLQSTAYITARATCTRLEQSRQLFLCTQNGTDACLAAVRFPPRPWKLRILASPFISATRMQRMDSVHNFVQDLLEVLVFLTVLATLGVMGWLLREIILNRRKRSDDGGEDKTDPHLVVPSSLDIMFEGMLDAVCFIIGCGLLLLAASTFLQKFAFGNNPADMLLLCYPLIFGPFALLRIFMCFNRRLLYHNLFLKGVMIDFSTAASRSDFLLSYTYLGFAVAVAVLLFDALSCVHDRIIGWKAMAIQTVVFTSPLYYMVSSLLNSLRLEQEAINRMCMQKLEQGSDAERVEPSSEHKLTPISEGIFCRAARERQDLNACIELARFEETAERQRSAASFAALEGGQDEDDEDDDAETESDYFKTMDMFWVPRLVSGHSNSISLLLVVSMPVVTLLAMLLCLASLAWLIKHRTDVPEIVGLVTDVPGLVPKWDFEVMDYALFIPRLHGTTTLSASSQLERTHHMNATMFDGDLQIGETITSTSRQLTQHVPLKRKNSSYPTIIQFLAGTLSQERVYQITALEIHILVRSMLLTGVTKDGSTYEVCYPFRGSWKGRAIAIPRNLCSLRIEAAFQEFHLALPVSENHSSSEFVTVFTHLDEDRITIPAYMRAYAQRSCATLCAKNFKCYGYKDVRTGCYFATGPSVPEISCMELHQRKTRQNSRVQISAKFCNTHDADNCAQSTSQNQVVKASLDQQVLTFPKLPSVRSSGQARSRERASVTMQASTSLGSILYPDTPYEVNFIRGTPLVKKLVYTKGTLQETNVKPDGTQTFLLSLSYNPNDLLGSFYVYFGVILEDFTEFEVQWEAPLQLVNLSRQSVYFRRLCEPAFYDFSCCGGHVETYVVKAEIDKWVPNQILRGKVVSKSHPSLFRPGFVEIDLVFEGGGITPLQSIIRKDCMVAICRGQPGVLDACLNSTAENCTDLSLCKERCVSHSMDKCVDKAGMPSMDSERRGDLGYISNVANDLLPEALASKREFLRWLDIEIWESSQKYFTQDVLIDIAEHCSFRSGLLSLFRPGRVNTSFSMVSILEALVRNPSFSFNGPFSQIPVLRTMFHDKKEDFLQPLGSVASVALYQKSLRPFTLAVCLATDPLSPKFVNQDLLAHIIGDMRLAVSHGDLAEVNQSQAVLKALSLCVKRKGKRFQRFSAPECRSRSSGITLKDGSSPSFFALAPTEEAFLNLLPVCETGGWMEKDNRTILHLAAEKNFGRPFVEIMNSKNPSLIPDVNSTYMDTSIVGVGTKTSWVKVVGRAAIHDACRSGCGPCVKALLARDASGRMGLNLTMFPSWWDPVFHPWMMDYLLKSTKRNRHSYRSIWGVQPIHIATLHHCSECLEALVGSSDTSGTSGETLKEVVEATMSLGYTTSYMADLEPDTKGHVQQTDVSDPSCLFSALDLAVLTNCSSCAQILLQAGASASQITLDQDSSMENLPVFDVLPKNGSKVQRCSSLRLTDKRRISYMMMFSWI